MNIALIGAPFNDHSPNPIQYFARVFDERNISYTHFDIQKKPVIPPTFDLYFRVDHGDYKDDIAHDLHPAVFYAIDTHLKKPFRKILEQSRHFDVVFCAQKPAVEKIRKKTKVDCQWVALGCDPAIHKKIETKKEYDIGFVGRNAEKFDRARQLRLLKRHYPKSYIQEANYKDISKIYSASKIGFNSSIHNDLNMRIFEILSSGCFLLTNKIKNQGLYDLFEDGRHFVSYTSDKDLLDKIEYYLFHEEKRESIAHEGHRRVTEHFTYHHSLQRIFNYLAFKFGGAFNELRI